MLCAHVASVVALSAAVAGQASERYSAVFPSGTRVRLVAITDGASRPLWGPDGTKLKGYPLPAGFRAMAATASGNLRLLYAQIALRGREMPSAAMQIVGGLARPVNATLRDGAAGGRESSWYVYGVANHLGSSADVRIGVADGPWKTLGSVAPKGGGSLVRTGVGFLRMARPDDRDPKRTVADVVLPADPATQAVQVRAYDRAGKLIPFLFSQTPQGGVLPDRVWFKGAYETIGKVSLQVRPYAWKTFKDVRLAPM
jgi:hypothetical protein